MSAIPNWRLLVYPPTGTATPTVIPRDQSFMLSAGIRMQVTPEGDCREASFNARGAGIKIPPLSSVQFQIENGGTWTNFFYGEVRQGGNNRDLFGENYILRSLAQRLKEVTLPDGFSTPEQPAHITVRDILLAVTGDGAGGYPLGNPCIIDPVDFSLISDLGFKARPIVNANQQTAAAFLDQIVQDGAGMNVKVRYGVNADRKFFCCVAAEGSVSVPMSNLIDIKWKPPVAEAPCTSVLWFISKRPNGTWITHRSVSPLAATYGQRVRAVSMDVSVNPWINLEIGSVKSFTRTDTYTNMYPPLDDSAWTDITGSAKPLLADGITSDTESTSVNLNAKGVALQVNAAVPADVERWVVHGGVTTSGTKLAAQGVGQVYSQATVAYVDKTASQSGLVLSNADVPKDATGAFANSNLRVAQAVPQKLDTALLDGLAKYYYNTPAVSPADLELRSFIDFTHVGTIAVPDAPGGAYASPVEAWEIRIGREHGLTVAALAGQAQAPENLAQAELIKLRDSKATMRALTAAQ